VYSHESGEFYKKIVGIDVPTNKFAYKILPSGFDLPIREREDGYGLKMLEAFLDDTSMCKFNVKAILEANDNVTEVIGVVYQYYEDILSVFHEMQSEA
jgi:hypothetical protein